MNSDLVAIARIAKPRGLRGELVAEILTSFPERFDNLDRVFGVSESGAASKLNVESHWFQKDRVVLKFRGINSRDEAETLRNLTISIPRDEVVELEDDSYFDWDLVDCEVVTVSGERLGRVKDVYRAGENENLVVQGSEKEFWIPFVKSICLTVDIENKLLTVDPPEGLLDF